MRSYDDWKTMPPEPKVVDYCGACGADLYEGCEYTCDRNNGDYYCDDNCLLDQLRKHGDVVTEEIEVG